MPGTISLEFKGEIVRSLHWESPAKRARMIDTWHRETGPNWRFCTLIINIDDSEIYEEDWKNVKTSVEGRERITYQPRAHL